MTITVAKAIEESVGKNRIVTIDGDGETIETIEALEALCDNSAEKSSQYGELIEFWGIDEDGEEWRVHVQLAEEGGAL